MKKLFVFGTVSLMLLVVILSGCAVGKATAIAPAQIKANSCDADGTCEAKSVVADTATLAMTLRTNWVDTAGITATGGNIQLGIYSPYAPALSITADGTSGPLSTFTGKVFADLFTVKETAKVNYLIVGQLAGKGNAYVCVDSVGTVFRSATPCV